ncbi:Nup133 N terminal like-domain-containing protein [Catenaria anguillulae PL171]|uniref:Nup133 N terminal like-domain-containing protein n=1 Tax=Catenaria anguillulae PL171 TaxID=765915 RepID=A0A1Y2HG66_9FUNG|nr:Nup133 N terminal like-domain-containing protein [Catenaria anguillulae PL171]
MAFNTNANPAYGGGAAGAAGARNPNTQAQQQTADVSYAFAAGNLSSSAYWSPSALHDAIGPHLDPAISETTLFAESKHIPLPEEFLRARYQARSRSYMGLFPEIRHAWITIDGSLHLWDYERNAGTCVLAKEYSTLITAVALVTPPPGLFVDNVKYLLVVATLSEIHVDCIRITKAASLQSPPAVGLSEMDMQVPADGVSVTAITSTREGRIFLGGYDGHVYELTFTPDTRLLDRIPIFGSGSDPSRRKLQKTNHTQSMLIKCLPDFIAHRLDNQGPIKSLTVHNEQGYLIVLYESRILSSATGDDDGGALKFIKLWDRSSDDPNQSVHAFRVMLDVPSLMRQAANNVIHHSRDFYLGKGSSVISLHPIEPSESTSFHFVAVTSTATRIYCSLQQKNDGSIDVVVNHVRLPPASQAISQSLGSPARYNLIPTATSFLGNASTGNNALHLRNPVAENFMPINTHAAYYARGVFLACHATGTDVGGSGSSPADLVLGAALDLPRDLPLLTRMPASRSALSASAALERAHIVHIAGRTAALIEIDPTTGGALDAAAIAQFPVDEQDRPRHFLLLNQDGLRVLVKRRPLDELAYLVRMGADKLPDKFVQAYGRAQVCAWLIALACGDVGGVAPNLAPATQAGGVAGFGPLTSSSSRMSNSSASRSAAYGMTPLTPAARLHVIQRMFHHAGGQPHPLPGSPAERTDLGAAVQQVLVQVSGCALGLDMYLRHMLQPIWDAAVLRKNPQHLGYEMAVNEGELTRIEAKLEKLSGFVDEWPKRKELFESPFAGAGAGAMPRPGSAVQPGDEYCWNREREYVQGLFHQVKLALEAVRFVRLLYAYKLPEVIQRAPANTSHPQMVIDYLLSTPLRDFAVSAGGREMCGQIATLVIQYAPVDGVGASSSGGGQGQQPTGGSLAALLQEWCSTLLSVEDVFAAGVLESVKMYHEQTTGDANNNVPKDEWARNVVSPRSPVLAGALTNALRVAGKLNDTHFMHICTSMLSVGFVRGVLDLALRRANEVDPNAEAVQYVREEATGGVMVADPRERLVMMRSRCYAIATGALERLNQEVAMAQAALERGVQAGDQQLQQQQFELKTVLTDAQVRVHQHAEASNDLLWHFALYDWYQRLGKASALIGLSTVYVEEWLKRQDTVEGQEMLARYYEARGRYADAARTLLALARIPVAMTEAEQQHRGGDSTATFTYKLEDRIGHLSSALQVAKATKNATLIQEIAEEYDVAHVQGQLVRSLLMLDGDKHAHAVARDLTDGELLTLQELLHIASDFQLPTLTFQLVAVGNPPEREVDLLYLRDLWFDALRPAATESLTSAVVTLTDLFSFGGYVAPASSAAEALADFPAGGVSMATASVSTSSALYNPEVWIEVVLNLTQTSPKLEYHPTWWVDIAARASVVDMANVTAELMARTTRAAMENRNQLLKVLTAAMKAWSQSGQVAWRSWGVQIEECALLVQRTQGVDEAIRREIEQLASEELPTNGLNSSFMSSAGW